MWPATHDAEHESEYNMINVTRHCQRAQQVTVDTETQLLTRSQCRHYVYKQKDSPDMKCYCGVN